jgi:hypothetical protein
MRHVLAVTSALAVAGAVVVGAQHHAQIARQHGAHGAVTHSTDHNKATHRIRLYQDGGAIEVAVADAKDQLTLEAVRQHLSSFGSEPHGAGHAAPAHDAARAHVRPQGHDASHAGVADLTRVKDKLTYTYSDTDRGGRVTIHTTDTEALTAVHIFLKQLIEQHKTGDATTIHKR